MLMVHTCMLVVHGRLHARLVVFVIGSHGERLPVIENVAAPVVLGMLKVYEPIPRVRGTCMPLDGRTTSHPHKIAGHRTSVDSRPVETWGRTNLNLFFPLMRILPELDCTL